MADWTFSPQPTTAVVGISSTTAFLTQSTSAYSVEVSNGTVGLSTSGINLNIFNTTTSFLPPKRPVRGQLYPRGVYNK